MFHVCKILLIILLKFVRIESSDVLGCGGFIKSHVQIDFSKIEVELYTKQGILKDKTNCAPNNGYYFIPLYDKGDYILQLQPPPGWSFNPTKVSIIVDGVSDLCSQGKDVNFIFKGFGITGRVESFSKSGTGPAGINVELKSATDVRTTTTSADGSFFFTPVYPGKYTVLVSHQKWKLLKNSVSVQVAEGNTELPSGSLVVGGYDVTGSVNSEGQPIGGVNLVLFQHDSNKGPVHVDGCEKGKPFQNLKQKGKQLCFVSSTNLGTFAFPTVSPGKYFIVPHYKGQNIHFHPELLEFEVGCDSVILSDVFEIVGFSISGRVLSSKNGKPLKGAKVLLNGKQIGTTNEDGSYSLEKIKADSYQLHVLADNLEFEETTVKVNPNVLQLPDLFPSKYQVCGNVLSEKPQTVIVSHIGSTNTFVTKSGTPDGKFCQLLSPGKYQLQVSVNDADKGQGIQFFPISHSLEVNASPVSGITFSQLKAVITGKVQCIREKDCASLRVVLRPIINDVPADNKDVIVGIVDNNVFTFKDIRPGDYELFLTPNKFCWKKDKHVITVSSTTEVAPAFVQSGYSVIFVSSHNAKATYKLPGQESKKKLEIVKGRMAYCVEKPGLYEFAVESCHTYETNVLTFNTDSEINEIYLTAQKHAVTVTIEAKQNFGNLFVTVNIGGVKKQEGPLAYKDKQYFLTLSLGPGESAILIPHSDILYFNPPILSINGHDDCTHLGVKFVAVKGKVFQGKIIPPLSGVLITIETENSEALMDETDAEGRYKFPPQDHSKNYKISAKKDTYVLVGPNEVGNFLAHKLAEVVVQVVDQTDDSPLQGALLSLSGGESYRSNLQTNEDGKITFHSLSPSEYFLRPMMKEYSFEPSSKIIDVREGATVAVKLRGRRVAYSSFGQVTSLNGEPEERITIIASGLSNCSHFSEEATSEPNGHFRIRGLQPYCSYNIKVKGGLDDKRSIERAAPSLFSVSVTKTDITNLKFTVFRATLNMDILVHVYSTNPEVYKTLKVKLMRESPPSSLIHTAKLDNSNYKITQDNNAGVLIQIPSVPLDEKLYSVQLEGTSPQTSKSAHTQYFTANSSFKYIDLEYLTKTSTTEQNIKQTSLWALLLIFASLVGVYNIEQTGQFVREQLFKINVGNISGFINSFRRKSTTTDYVIDKNEIDQIVESINATKRKVKPRKT